MKINISIDLQPHNSEELDRLARIIKNIDAILNAIELEIDNYRQRLERVEEMTTRFEPNQEEN
jgi:molecular chaperone GrpE (heat shock protein)